MSVLALPRRAATPRRAGPGWTTLLVRRKTTLVGAVIMAVVYSPRVARVVRGSVLVIRETSYVEAARALGASDLTLIARHVLPNCLSPVIVQGSFTFAAAVLTEAALSFLGVGVPPYVPSWGVILAEGRLYIQQAPWLLLYPGAAIMLTSFGLNLLGHG